MKKLFQYRDQPVLFGVSPKESFACRIGPVAKGCLPLKIILMGEIGDQFFNYIAVERKKQFLIQAPLKQRLGLVCQNTARNNFR